MNICTRIALISSLTAVTSVGLLTTKAQAFNLVGGTVNITSIVLSPASGTIYTEPASVTATAFGNWQAETDSAGTILIDWTFSHATAAPVFTSTTFSAPGAGVYSGTFTASPITASGLLAGFYKTSLTGNIGTSEYIYETNTDTNNWKVQPVPEPITMLGSGIALGFGAFLKRKQKAAQNKS
jgi:hypothetical protein